MTLESRNQTLKFQQAFNLNQLITQQQLNNLTTDLSINNVTTNSSEDNNNVSSDSSISSTHTKLESNESKSF